MDNKIGELLVRRRSR